MATDDSMFESGHQPVYKRERSREFSAEEIDEMERRARKEGKRDIILSQLVEQQSETANTLKDVNTRLTQGDGQIAGIKNDLSEIASSVKKIGEQADKTSKLLDRHLVGYESHVSKVDEDISEAAGNISKIRQKVIDTSSSLESHIQKSVDRWENEDKSNSFVTSIIGQIISSLAVMIIIGGLIAYLAKDNLFGGKQQNNNPQNNNPQNNNPQNNNQSSNP